MEAQAADVKIPKGVSIPSMILIYVLSITALFYLVVGILYLYMLQKFYMQGSGLSLLNTHNGKVLYGSLVAAFICFAAATCTNNRSPVSLHFMLIAAIAIIVAIVYMKKLQDPAILMYLLPQGDLSPINPASGKMTHLGGLKIHKLMFGLSIAIVILIAVTWFFGMYIAVYPRRDSLRMSFNGGLNEVRRRFNGGGSNELNEVDRKMYF